jgi:hypothetical protein
MTDETDAEESRLDFLKTQETLRIDQMIADNAGLNYKDTHTQEIPTLTGKVDITKRKRK